MQDEENKTISTPRKKNLNKIESNNKTIKSTKQTK